MATIYGDYTRDKIGWFFGLSGWQLGILAVTALPIAGAVQRGAWAAAGVFMLAWVVVVVVTVAPVRGRSATGWAVATIGFALGALTGWSRFRSRASQGRAEDLDEVDLPGALQGVTIHDGPPMGASFTRPAIIADHSARTWAVTAAVVHPGIGMADSMERDRYGVGLGELVDLASRTELIDEVLFLVRTVGDDGAERDVWLARHRRSGGPAVARAINGDLHQGLTRASVRTESFVTIVVPETRIKREARESGGGLEGRARVLAGLMSEVEAHLRSGMGMTGVTWLTSPELALACRTGFAPGDRAGVIDALADRQQAQPSDPRVTAEVPWAMAGPSGADPVARHYSHDAWNSVSATIKLPVKGAVMGALAPILTPTEPGERRSILVAYPILRQSTADRQTATGEWAADLSEELRVKARVRPRARTRADAARVRGLDVKLARGNALTRPYAVCTVTVPKTVRVAEYGRRLDAAIRRAGFAPLRLDLSQDIAFAASSVPMGVSLARRGGA